MLRHLFDFPGAAVLQNLHPLVVHFPLAFLLGATALYLAAALARRENWAWVALWMLALGALSATAAIRTGLAAGTSVMVAPAVRARILLQHEHLMLTAWGLSLGLLGWAILAPPMPRRGALAFLALLLLMAGVLVKGADYGAWMVFGYNAGGSLPQPIEFSS
ncbi:MAG TPA: DUF2231 domain-containing protein [Candidatus Binataceae bacterium]|nr:DUF2231 domain-containing protein [Candidatus Binataceae bacterium]